MLSFAKGNIDDIINTDSSERLNRVTNNGTYGSLPNITDIAYPLCFTFTNEPSSNSEQQQGSMLFTYSNPLIPDFSIKWDEMEANSPFDIYISVLDQDSELDISYFTFMRSGPDNTTFQQQTHDQISNYKLLTILTTKIMVK